MDVQNARPAELVAISADSKAELDRAGAQLSRELAMRPGIPLAQVVRELPGQADGAYRRAFVARDTTEAARVLRKPGPDLPPVTEPVPVYFLFPGVGDHYAGMARGLYRHEPRFRHWLDHCADLLLDELGTDLRTVLYPSAPEEPRRGGGIDLARLMNRHEEEAAPLERTLLAQPVVFAVEYALARLLGEWGITPAGMAGYSLGEYVAATLAGVLDLSDALALVARRARLIEALPAGSMTVVMLGAVELAERLDDELSLAAVDGPNLCVAAGPVHALERLEKRLAGEGVASLRTTARHAFHSSMLSPIEQPLAELVRDVETRPPSIPFLSNVTGTWITDEQARDPGHWARHARDTVRFHDELTELWRQPSAIALEVGAGQMLGSLAAQHPGCPRTGEPPVFATVPAASANEDGETALLGVVGRLWQAGVPVDWSGLWPEERR